MITKLPTFPSPSCALPPTPNQPDLETNQQALQFAMYWKGLLFSERSTKSNEKDLALSRHISRVVKECVVTSYIAKIIFS